MRCTSQRRVRAYPGSLRPDHCSQSCASADSGSCDCVRDHGGSAVPASWAPVLDHLRNNILFSTRAELCVGGQHFALDREETGQFSNRLSSTAIALLCNAFYPDMPNLLKLKPLPRCAGAYPSSPKRRFLQLEFFVQPDSIFRCFHCRLRSMPDEVPAYCCSKKLPSGVSPLATRADPNPRSRSCFVKPCARSNPLLGTCSSC